MPDGGSLPRGQVADTVQLDEILRTFDPETRERFSTWLDQQGRRPLGNGEAINDALGNLTPFAENTDDVLEVLRVQSGATRRLVRNTGEVFEALSERRGQLRGLIRNSNRVWQVTARRDAQLADTFRVLPTFLREGRTTTAPPDRVRRGHGPADRPAPPGGARAVADARRTSTSCRPTCAALLRNFGPLVRVSKKGLPATSEALDNTRPFLGRLDTFLREFTPIIDYLGLYKREIAAFFANDAAVTQAKEGNLPRYLRTQNPVTPEIMAAYPNRLSTNRSNPYPVPGGSGRPGHLPEDLRELPVHLEPGAGPPAATPALPQSIVDVLDYYAFGGHEEPGRRTALHPAVAARPADERRRGPVPAPPAAAVAEVRPAP